MSRMTELRDAARSAGQKRFATGEPCKNGHIAERLVSSMVCCACAAEYRPAYQKKNMGKWKAYRDQNRDRLAAEAKEYRRINGAEISKRDIERRRAARQENPYFALIHRLRARVAMAYRGKLKPASTEKLIGCTFEKFAAHIESQFCAGMTWENRRLWHIDHIVPLSAFDLEDSEQALRAFHWTNCRPLWAEENLRKGSRIIVSADMLKGEAA
ncbi:hypothetical protein [Stutzerimonas frequens]|uniref:HNH endonuclease n=1 Tax=Stutzerimonas frequens TaxID=2968969 RepID=A0AA47DZH3_9GAMM|nr:hypothetical protein [Stutzerimonas frequens]WAE51187.1 hypothetical protein OSV15_16080 [Stutzerimonas frequens]